MGGDLNYHSTVIYKYFDTREIQEYKRKSFVRSSSDQRVSYELLWSKCYFIECSFSWKFEINTYIASYLKKSIIMIIYPHSVWEALKYYKYSKKIFREIFYSKNLQKKKKSIISILYIIFIIYISYQGAFIKIFFNFALHVDLLFH